MACFARCVQDAPTEANSLQLRSVGATCCRKRGGTLSFSSLES